VSCPLLTAPDNGTIDCTGLLFEDTCTFSCDDGYELTGSENRTCQNDQTWSGIKSMCLQGALIQIYKNLLWNLVTESSCIKVSEQQR